MYRVLFFIHIIDNQLFEQVWALLAADPDLEIILAPRDGLDEAQWKVSGLQAFAERLSIHRPVLRRLRGGMYGYANQVIQICRQERVSLIATHMAQTVESRATYLATRLSRLPYVVSMYGRERHYFQPPVLSRKDRFWVKLVLRSAKLLICHDRTLLQTAERIVPDCIPRYLLYNAVNPQRAQRSFDLVNLRRKYGVSGKHLVVLYNHRMQPVKRPLVYVEAMPLIRQQCPDVCFLFVGPRCLDTELGREVQRRIMERGLQANLVWIDRRISGYEMDEMYAISDVAVNMAELVVPSLSTLEAMSFGIPLVISDELDSELYVQHGQNGFIVEPKPVAVADAVVRILRDDELRQRMGEIGRVRAVCYFDIRDWGERVTQCYRHVLFGEPMPSPQEFE